MSLVFPPSPGPGDTYTAEGTTFIWTGTVWVVAPAGLIFATQAEAEAGERWDRAMSPLRGAEAIAEFDVPPEAAAPPLMVCRAICNFNGVTEAIISQKNIASVVRNATGIFTLTFTDPLEDSEYTILGHSNGIGNHPSCPVSYRNLGRTATSFVIQIGNTGGNTVSNAGFLVNPDRVQVAVFK